MNRRQFLLGCGAAAVASQLPIPAVAQPAADLIEQMHVKLAELEALRPPYGGIIYLAQVDGKVRHFLVLVAEPVPYYFHSMFDLDSGRLTMRGDYGDGRGFVDLPWEVVESPAWNELGEFPKPYRRHP